MHFSILLSFVNFGIHVSKFCLWLKENILFGRRVQSNPYASKEELNTTADTRVSDTYLANHYYQYFHIATQISHSTSFIQPASQRWMR